MHNTLENIRGEIQHQSHFKQVINIKKQGSSISVEEEMKDLYKYLLNHAYTHIFRRRERERERERELEMFLLRA